MMRRLTNSFVATLKREVSHSYLVFVMDSIASPMKIYTTYVTALAVVSSMIEMDVYLTIN